MVKLKIVLAEDSKGKYKKDEYHIMVKAYNGTVIAIFPLDEKHHNYHKTYSLEQAKKIVKALGGDPNNEDTYVLYR